jgi:1-deoxy-D-xylulose-5-phosphate synthase
MDFEYKHLFDINSPKDLRKLKVSDLPRVAEELREYVVDTITKSGGHFGAGLGVVELTTALHYVFDTPKDKIVLDTGHQGYPHKVLTGRREELKNIRQMGGISGFLKRTESEYDSFGAGHASTSISAALGMATARDLNGEDYEVAAVIGDGAMTGGLAFEAMNNIGFQQRKMLVVMNDNNHSIATNVSAFSNYFNEIYTNEQVQKLRTNMLDMTKKFEGIGDRIRHIAEKIESGVKGIITPGMLFEAFGFNYIGPVNGHNVLKLVRILETIKKMDGPVLLHIVTQKGFGYKYATKEKKFLHAIGKIDKITGESLEEKPKNPKPKYQDIFGDAITEIAEQNEKVVGITAAMPDGTGLDKMQEKFPDRVFDVGIAEGHGVTFAAGLACEGIIPVCAIYSTFLQRAYDHIIHDVALQKLHVVFALDRGGLVGADGPTHHGVMDLAYLRTIPGMVLMAPKDEQELRDMLYTAIYDCSGPVAIRYPRGEGMGIQPSEMKNIEIGKSEIVKKGKDIVILAVGNMLAQSLGAAKILEENGISAEIINARFIKPLDKKMIDAVCEKFDFIMTVEDGQCEGGFGSAVAEYMVMKQYKNNLYIHAIPDKFIGHGTQNELYAELGLDSKGISEKVKLIIANQYSSVT